MVWPPLDFAVAVVSLLLSAMSGGWSMQYPVACASRSRRIEVGRRLPLASSPGESKDSIDSDATGVDVWLAERRKHSTGLGTVEQKCPIQFTLQNTNLIQKPAQNRPICLPSVLWRVRPIIGPCTLALSLASSALSQRRAAKPSLHFGFTPNCFFFLFNPPFENGYIRRADVQFRSQDYQLAAMPSSHDHLA
ncbi:hypothetical protein HU200_025705 [Digitaria exilis]|uniref:Secreted protein n=1 Tax=Digitaria exilis TaxID=1010633 RepID=A0A835BZP2_9POAL|nr:hypothetical protein HU200_025705 [Digitaria exilis]